MPGATLYLVPVDLAESGSVDWIGAHLRDCVLPLRRFVVEHPKSARRFLKNLGLPLPDLQFEVLDEHSKAPDLERLEAFMLAGGDVGLLSEAGCPAIADPGAGLVARAHRAGMRVVPLVGPSSIVLALMASGLEGQRFAFNGYLPQDAVAREAEIRRFEEWSRRSAQTQVFIEAPYRNEQLFAALLAGCREDTLLSIATDLCTPAEAISTKTIADWRRAAAPGLHKRPTVFLLLAAGARSTHRAGRSSRPK